MRVRALLLISFITLTGYCYGQDLNPAKKSFIEFGIGAGNSLFRDKATSPLFYDGFSGSGSVGILKSGLKEESDLNFTYSYGVQTNEFNNTYKSATTYIMDVSYTFLRSVDKWSNGIWNFKAGGTLISSTNFRENTALMNNSMGVENISNLMATGKVALSVPRVRAKTVKLPFFRIRLRPTYRDLSLSFSSGLLNMNYRPGYAYNYLPQITGTNMNSFSDYKFSVNGFRFMTKLSFTTYIKNGNGFRLSYLFDVYNAPGRHEPFNFAKHTFQFSILFNYR